MGFRDTSSTRVTGTGAVAAVGTEGYYSSSGASSEILSCRLYVTLVYIATHPGFIRSYGCTIRPAKKIGIYFLV